MIGGPFALFLTVRADLFTGIAMAKLKIIAAKEFSLFASLSQVRSLPSALALTLPTIIFVFSGNFDMDADCFLEKETTD